MKIKKKDLDFLRDIIKEELQRANPIARKILREADIFQNKNRMLPSEWESFKKKFLKKNKDHKVVSGRDGSVDFEAIVNKANPKKAIIKYLPDDMSAMHDMKSARFFDYLR